MDTTGMTARAYWAAGLCPCCGAELDWWPRRDPKPIAEGVAICGRCAENEHDREPDFVAALLLAIVAGHDEPIDAYAGPA